MDTSINSIPTEQPTVGVPQNPIDIDPSYSLPKKSSAIKEALVVIFLCITAFLVTTISHPFLLALAGPLILPLPIINLLVFLILFPYGFEVILWIPLLIVFCIFFRKLLKLDTSKRKLLFILTVTCLVVVLSQTALFYYHKYQNNKYIEDRIAVVNKQRNQVVGTAKAEFTYKGAQPTYSQSGSLESITLTFLLKLPKVGSYKMDTGIFNTGYNLYDNKEPDIYIPNKLLEFTYGIENSEKEIKLVFDAKDLHTYSYSGPLNFNVHAVWRTNIAIDAPFGGGTQDSARVDSIDSGKSISTALINIPGISGTPIYAVGSFPLQN